jgi:uncharacterized protein (DUF342 family)
MPVITRSNTTGPTKMMVTGVKRKFIEIVDTDDDVSTDSEFDVHTEDDIEELKDDLKETEQSNDALINILIKERETIQKLQAELADIQQKYDSLLNSVKEIQRTCWQDMICFGSVFVLASGFALASAFMCNIHENELLNL